MSGRLLVSLMVGFAILFGAALVYFQNYAYYHPVAAAPQETVSGTTTSTGTSTTTDARINNAINTVQMTEIRLTPFDTDTPETIAVTGFKGIDAPTSPLKFRGCFHVALGFGLLTETYRVFDRPTPLKAPGWFGCFDSKQLTLDLESGIALAFMGEEDITDGIDRLVAIYPDGRAFAWHQVNERFSK